MYHCTIFKDKGLKKASEEVLPNLHNFADQVHRIGNLNKRLKSTDGSLYKQMVQSKTVNQVKNVMKQMSAKGQHLVFYSIQ